MRVGWLRKLFGDRGERTAARFLRKQGYRILARQVRNSFGEIDLIALDGDVIVFVEVKTRSTLSAGLPVEAVDHRKQQQITRTALAWMKRRRLLDQQGRFDVVAILWQSGNPPQIQHYRNAFEAAAGSTGMYS